MRANPVKMEDNARMTAKGDINVNVPQTGKARTVNCQNVSSNIFLHDKSNY